MTFPSPQVITVPFCGACGWDVFEHNLNDDLFCDACGADLVAYGFFPLPPFRVATDNTVPGQVEFGWTENPRADETESRWRLDFGTWSAWEPDDSPTLVFGAAGQRARIQLRSLVGLIPGPERNASAEIQ